MRNFDDATKLDAPITFHRSRYQEIVIVFVGHTECPHLSWLKKGFRHCFAAIRINERWMICDPLKSHIEFSLIDLPPNFDLGAFYRDRGHAVLVGNAFESTKSSPSVPELLSCVAIVKRIIGIQSFWILTPWQLFRYLNSKDDLWRLIE